jgi:hypothetical protein
MHAENCVSTVDKRRLSMVANTPPTELFVVIAAATQWPHSQHRSYIYVQRLLHACGAGYHIQAVHFAIPPILDSLVLICGRDSFQH